MRLEDHKVLDVFQTITCSSWLHRESRPTYQRVPHEVTSNILFNVHVCLAHTCWYRWPCYSEHTCVHPTARVWCFGKRFAKWKVLAPSFSYTTIKILVLFKRIEAMWLLKINFVLKRKFKLFRDHKFSHKNCYLRFYVICGRNFTKVLLS